MNNRTVLYLVFLLLSLPICAREIILPEEEAAESVLSTQLGDEDVELYLSGAWKGSMELSGGLGFAGDKDPIFPAPFPGLSQGFLFQQSPDLLISLWIAEKYFFEASFIEGYALNTFLLGYNGGSDNLIKRFRLGNTDTGINPIPFFEIPEASEYSLGTALEMGGENFSFETLLRFDPAEAQKRIYLGEYLVSEHRIPLTSYLEDRFFYLPGERVENLTILLEKGDGDIEINGRFYRVADSQDCIYSTSEETDPAGFIWFREPVNSSVLVTYSGIPWSEETVTSGLQYQDFQETAGAVEYLILYRPGQFSPTQISGFYSLPETPYDTPLIEVSLVKKGDNRGQRILYTLFQEENILALKGLFQADSGEGLLYPFLSLYPDLYGAERILDLEAYDQEILVQILTPQEYYEVPSNLLPGSLQIYREGYETRDYSLEGNRILFNSPPKPGERIELYYRTRERRQRGGDILFAGSGKVSFGDLFNLRFGTGFKWNLAGTYAETPRDNPGSMIISMEGSGKAKSINYFLRGGLSLSTPNSSGVLRLFGMSNDLLYLSLSDNTVFPSSVPTSIPELNKENRGKLIYKDYRIYDPAGGVVLTDYSWEIPETQVYEYTSGNRPGPYTAYTKRNDPFNGEVLVLDYSLEKDQWVGAQIALTKNQAPMDFSIYNSLFFYWKKEGTDLDNLIYHIEIGTLGEDLDNDGLLDKEESIYSQGFVFDHGNEKLLIGGGPKGTGNFYIDSEDFNGNGVLDWENPNGIVSLSTDSTDSILQGQEPGEDFFFVEIPLTEDLKNKLRKVPFLRVVIYNDSPVSGSTEGRLLLGGIALSGSSLYGESDSTASFMVSQREEPAEMDSPDLLFTDRETGSRFLRLEWGSPNPLSSGEEIVLTGYTMEVQYGEYDTLTWFMRFPEEISENLQITVNYSNSQDEGLSCTFNPLQEGFTENQWQRYELSISQGVLRIEGKEVAEGINISITETDKLNKFILTFKGQDSGIIDLDEVQLLDPRISLSGAVEMGMDYSLAGPFLSLGGKTILRDLSLSQVFSLTGRSFAQGLKPPPEALFSSRTTASVKLLFFDLSTGFILNYSSPGIDWVGNHSLTFSLPWLKITDFFLLGRGNSEQFSRGNSLILSPVDSFLWEINTETKLFSQTLNQSWQTLLNSPTGEKILFKISAELGQDSWSFKLPTEDYLSSWIKSYSLLLPNQTDPSPKRRGSLLVSLALDTYPLGFGLDPLLDYEIAGEEERVQTATGRINLQLPVRFQKGSPEEWGFTLLYSRAFTLSDSRSSDDSRENFLSDLENLAEILKTSRFLYSTLPYGEIFDSTLVDNFIIETQGLTKAKYEPEASFSLSLPAGSYWYNLLVPNTLQFSLSQGLIKERDTFSRLYFYKFSTKTTVLNLFGRQGLYPLFPFYRTDELIFSGSFQGESEELGLPSTYKFFLQSFMTFFGTGKKKFYLENRFEGTKNELVLFKEEIYLAYSWPSPGLILPDKIKETFSPYFLHEEILSFKIQIKNNEETTVPGSFIPKHKTTLFLNNLGEISFWAGLGVAWERYSLLEEGTYSYILGYTFGIEANLWF